MTHGLNRAQMVAAYERLFPNAQYPADFQTILAYGAGVITEQVIETAGSLDAAKLKAAAIALSGNNVTATAGEYEIDETGKQYKNELSIMQTLPTGLEVVYPAAVATAKPVYPVPRFTERN